MTHRRLFRFAARLLCVVFAFTTMAAAAATPLVEAVGPIGLTVGDMERSLQFYTEVLPFRKVSDREVTGEAYERLEGEFGVRMRIVRLALGEESIELTEYLAPEGRPVPADSRSNDRWFQHVAIIVSDMDRAYAWLRQHQVRHASSGPQRLPDWNRAAGGIQAFYFKDPDGHPLEILQFPDGKGDARWHHPTDALFLGIDHTAIVVGATATSLAFYRDTLGLRVAGESENYGTEQEHLNNIFGARLRITSLRAATGPGIEFLEYLTPGDGRAMPADVQASDLIHWQTTLRIRDAGEAARRLRSAGVSFLSSDVVELPEGKDAPSRPRAFVVRDPDGHAMELLEASAP